MECPNCHGETDDREVTGRVTARMNLRWYREEGWVIEDSSTVINAAIQAYCSGCGHRWEECVPEEGLTIGTHLTCNTCSKVIMPKDPMYFTNGGVFCSRSCKNEWKNTPENLRPEREDRLAAR